MSGNEKVSPEIRRANGDNSGETEPVQSPGYSKHFWVASAPSLESVISILPRPGQEAPEDVQLVFIDPDGNLINESAVQVSPTQPAFIESGFFLGACKLESGIKHAHLVANAATPMTFVTRVFSPSGAIMLGDLERIDSDRNSFAPVVFSPMRHVLIAVVNQLPDEAHVRCQLFCASRIPEIEIEIPPLGCRLLELNREFEQFLQQEGGGKSVRAYLRFAVRGAASCGVHVLESYSHAQGKDFINAIC